jgi:hypothetical protein
MIRARGDDDRLRDAAAIDLDELSIQLRRLADSSEFGNGLRGE